jgi:hypothetical protein
MSLLDSPKARAKRHEYKTRLVLDFLAIEKWSTTEMLASLLPGENGARLKHPRTAHKFLSRMAEYGCAVPANCYGQSPQTGLRV